MVARKTEKTNKDAIFEAKKAKGKKASKMKSKSKHIYRAKNVNHIYLEGLCKTISGKSIAVGIDVAKEDFVGVLMDESERVELTFKWKHPTQTYEMLTFIDRLTEEASEVEVAMEPTGTYGDSIRFQLLNRQIPVYQVSAKHVHDMSEVYDGVPSQHDAKSSAIIAKLHREGRSSFWDTETDVERALKAAIGTMVMYDGQYRDNINRLEAFLARYWPEATTIFDLDSTTLLTVLEQYGGPRQVTKNAQEANKLMKKVGRHFLKLQKIDALLSSARTSLGASMLEEEAEAVRLAASDTLRAKKAKNKAQLRVEKIGFEYKSIAAMGKAVGKATAAVVVANLGDPENFDNAASYLKCAGMNLKERSSGKYEGQLKITKRGSGIVRKYLFLAAMRMIQKDPLLASWYKRKVARDGGKSKMRALVAVMRKLLKGLWYVGHYGVDFDSSQLVSVRHLSMENT